MHRVVVTGYGLVTPLGQNVEEVWKKICNGESGVRRTTTIKDVELCRSLISGECLGFSCDGYLPPHEAKRLERFVQYVIVSAINAVKQSGLDFSKEDRDRCAAIVGSGVGGLGEIEYQHSRLLEKGPSKVSPFTIPKIMPNAAAGNLSIHFGLYGPSYSVGTACASGINALADAVRMIRYGEADVILAGSSEAAVTQVGIAGFCSMKALSERNDEPQRASRPFDKNRDGFVLSDGAGVMVLESLEHAKARRAEILGEIRGTGCTSDGTHITQPDEDGTGAMKAILKSLRDAGINPNDVDYINAHGTSTHLGDIAETRAIKRALGDHARKVAISSTKSQIGHLLGGSGAVETIFSLLSVRDDIAPPTINLDEPDPECDLDFTPHTAKELKISTVVSNSFGFGGHNACVVVSKFVD